MFPFGYGLSYTEFQYGDLRAEYVQKHDTVVEVRGTVSNVGTCDGDEVVQLYVRDEQSSIVNAGKLLKGFQRVSLKAGESAEVVFYITGKDLSFYNTQKGWHFEPGEFVFSIRGDSRE